MSLQNSPLIYLGYHIFLMETLLDLIKPLTETCVLHSAKYVFLEGKKWKWINKREEDIWGLIYYRLHLEKLRWWKSTYSAVYIYTFSVRCEFFQLCIFLFLSLITYDCVHNEYISAVSPTWKIMECCNQVVSLLIEYQIQFTSG